ncbi:type II toxin-antitoxin system VapC family toxin [Fodinicola acaciae]|uniref:type II toxin-antitoxin system VapC family toxin n=1 Tax=Fodinicola acaciae TaxID=2681555 RepID=UPI0013D65FC4|nr:type II toxin-antitoxin system VapC family toxin [Fodinicola acaciae]
MIYFDTSAIVRLVIPHDWTRSLRSYLGRLANLRWVTSVIAVVETNRALMREGATERELAIGGRYLAEFRKVGVTDEVVQSAIAIPSRTLKSLDAIHVASALEVGAEVLVTYDKTMIKAARDAGLRTASPGLDESRS